MSQPPTRPRRRWLWIFLGGFALGCVVIVSVLLLPPVQGWLVRRLLPTQGNWKLNFERIGVGPTGVDASGLTFAMPGLSASSAPIAIRVAPSRLFSKRELRVERVEATKIRVIFTPSEYPPSDSFDGILRVLQLPLPWALDTAQLDGDIVVRDGGESRLAGNFSLRGGGVTSSTPGVFAYELSANSLILPVGPENKFSSAGTIRISQMKDHRIGSIVLDGDLKLPVYGKLSFPPGRIHFEINPSPKGEAYLAQLSLGEAVRVTLEATLDLQNQMLQGRTTVVADETAASSLLGAKSPKAKLTGELAFALNVRNGDLTADCKGDLDAADWSRMMPQLALVDALKGHLTAAITRHSDRLVLTSLNASLRAEKSNAAVILAIRQPVEFPKISGRPLADLSLQQWPIEWANPFLEKTGLQLSPGKLSAAWAVSLNDQHAAVLTPTEAATLAPIAVTGAGVPRLPSHSLSFRPRAEVSASACLVNVEDLSIRSTAGDYIDGQFTLSRRTETGLIATTGRLQATLPTVFSKADEKPPFRLEASWDGSLGGTKLHLSGLQLAALSEDRPSPLLSFNVQRPFDFNLDSSTTPATYHVFSSEPAEPLVTFIADHFPLSWLSKWIPNQTMTGTLVAGTSTLRAESDGSFIFETRKPWQFNGVSVVAEPGDTNSKWDAHLAPEIRIHGDQFAVVLKDLLATDTAGNRVSGQISAAGGLDAKNLSASLALEAELPALPHSEKSFGALQGKLHGKFHAVNSRIMGADEFGLQVTGATGNVFSIEAPRPFIFGLSNSDMLVMSTLAPLQIKLGAFPLAWSQPWLQDLNLEGNCSPVDLTLSAQIDRYALRAIGPVKLDHVSARRGNRDLIRDATLSFIPGADFSVIGVTKPKFQFVYTGNAYATDVQADFAGRHAIDADVAVGFKGNEATLLPDLVNFSSRTDFSALPNAAEFGLPVRGVIVTRINGDLLGGKPVELWSRLSGVPAQKPDQSLPPLEITLRGKVSLENVFTGGVELLLATTPQPTDASFNVKLNLLEGGLDITSAFRSKFIDGSSLLALARAFPSSATPANAKIIPETKGRLHDTSYAAFPFWGELTGSFDLDIGAFEFSPYRIEQIRGRLDATHTSLDLHDLSGEMFAGRLGGGVKIEHSSGITTGEHTLAGGFHIQQFESARVVQTVFPNQLASVDAKIDVRANVASHGNSFVSLIDQSTAGFSVDGSNGLIRLTVPKSDLISTAAVFGGTVLLSPELRALGRLLKKFAEMPVDELHITGRKTATGEVTLDEFRFESPQARLLGHGRVTVEKDEPLMQRPLQLSLQLAAKDELAVILSGMSLLEKKPRADGFRAMNAPFEIGGRAGAPDTTALYDLFAKAVSGSHGTWGFLMRKAQSEMDHRKPVAPAGVSAP